MADLPSFHGYHAGQGGLARVLSAPNKESGGGWVSQPASALSPASDPGSNPTWVLRHMTFPLFPKPALLSPFTKSH